MCCLFLWENQGLIMQVCRLGFLLIIMWITSVNGYAQFTDVTTVAGVDLEHVTSQTIITLEDGDLNTVNHVEGLNNAAHLFATWLTGGVAVGDYDGDGWPDLYVLGGDIGQSLLFRNLGNGSFSDVTTTVGLNNVSGRVAGTVFADYDADGDLDIFIGGALQQSPRLMRNDVDTTGIFVDVFDVAMPDFQSEFSPNAWGAAFGDFDNNGCLDILIPRSLLPPGPSPTFKTPEGSTQHLWKNECDGTFTDASLSAQISQIFDVDTFPVGGRDQTFTGNFTDVNHDGYADILMTGDIGTDLVLVNQQDGTFVDRTDRFVMNDKNAMGAGVGDVNNDGHIDWFTANIGAPNPGNRLFLGNGDETFTNVSQEAGIVEGHWGWGSCFMDMNLDRNLDIFQVNGFYFPRNDNPDATDGTYSNAPALMFVSNGDGTYTESASILGISDQNEGRGVSCFDYDRDGDIDIAISNHKGPFKLYRNDLPAEQRNFITVTLSGLGANTQGIGARVYVRSESPSEPGQLMHEIRAGNNFLSANLAEANFGLGDWQGPFTIKVVWPIGVTSEMTAIAKNQFITINEPEDLFINGFE